MNTNRDFFLADYERCFYCARCIKHDSKQHFELLARWCDTHHRWCTDHKIHTTTSNNRAAKHAYTAR